MHRLGTLVLTALVALGLQAGARAAPAALPADGTARVVPSYGAIPTAFEPNLGQAPAEVRFVARSRGVALTLDRGGARLALRRSAPLPDTPDAREKALARIQAITPRHETARLDIVLAGAAGSARMEALDPLPGKSHYLHGDDPGKWVTDVPHFARIAYRDVYPGIDQVFHGERLALEYDLVVHPGADPSRIRIRFGNGTQLSLDASGDLIVGTAGGAVRHRKPVAWQDGAARERVDAQYVLNADGTVTLRLGPYDASRTLVIDPVVDYTTYLGGDGDDMGRAIGVDAAGNAYIAGTTQFGSTFPRVDPLQPDTDGTDAFVTKINAAGTAILYSTYLGGTGDDIAFGLAARPDGSVVVAGQTTAHDFPVVHALQATHLGAFGFTGFVARLTPSGNAFVFSTYFGGSGTDRIRAIALGLDGEVYVAGDHGSTDFPRTASISDCTLVGKAFVAKLSSDGTQLVYSTCVGGDTGPANSPTQETARGAATNGLAVAVDDAGHAYLSGVTSSIDFPAVNAIQPQLLPGKEDIPLLAAYVAKLTPQGDGLVYSTYIGGDYSSYGWGIAVDPAGNAYATGQILTADCHVYAPPCGDGEFPLINSVTPVPPLGPGVAAGYLVKIAPRGDKFIYTTFLGACGGGEIWGHVAADAFGNAYVTGSSNCVAGVAEGKAIVTKLDPLGRAILYFTTLGGASTARSAGNAIALDEAANVYVAGETYADGITAVGAVQPSIGGGPSYFRDAFVAKILAQPVATALTLESSLNPAPYGAPVTFTVTVPGSGGSVELRDGSASLGRVSLTPNASSTTFTLATLLPGDHSLVAVYTPPGNGAVLTSPALLQRILDLTVDCP